MQNSNGSGVDLAEFSATVSGEGISLPKGNYQWSGGPNWEAR